MNFGLNGALCLLLISLIYSCNASNSLSISRATELLVKNLIKFRKEFPNGFAKADENDEEEVFCWFATESKSKATLTDENENYAVDTNSLISSLSDEEITEQLENISPFFVSEEASLNLMIYSFILEYLGPQNVSDTKIFDALELANIKFILKKHLINPLIPEDMMFLILSFFYELVYEIDETLPTTVDQWRIIFVQKLLVRDMPKSMEYYLLLINEEIISNMPHGANEKINLINELIRKIVTFFSTNPSKNYLLELYNNTINLSYYLDLYAPELKFAVKHALHDLLVPYDSEKMTVFYDDLVSNFSFSQTFLDLFYEISTFLQVELRFNNKLKFKEARIMKAIYKKFPIDSNSNQMDCLKYLWTRNILNPFNLEYFLTFNCDFKVFIREIIKFENPGLVHYDIFSQLIRLRKYNYQTISKSQNSLQLDLFLSSKSALFFKLFITQVPTAINMFVVVKSDTETDRSRICWHIFNNLFVKFEHIKTYIQNLMSDDPLPLLFIKIEYLLDLRYLIFKKFNLKKSYKFDLIIKSRNRFIAANDNLFVLETYGLPCEKWKELQGQTLTFEELVEFINIEGLIDIFKQSNLGSGLDKLDEESVSSAPISILKFFHRGELEPVDELNTKNKCVIS